MSQRVKRALKSDDGPVPTKRRKGRPTMDDDDSTSIADSMGPWASRTQDIKPPNIYNRTVAEAPAELFRKDLISAMKLADSEPLTADEYWVIGDQWKQEWERGVQVPVNPDSLPGPSVTIISHCAATLKAGHEFKLPKSKYFAICKDESFDPDTHIMSDTPAKAEKACSYDLDDCDAAWLKIFNGERANMGLQPIKEEQLERVLEELEVRCWDKIQTIVKTEESLGIEFDENVICDVCRSPDSEESNEMVFCDSCNICVHQACYGITTIPSGQWLCRTCALGKRPECVLCPNKMGAMKSTQSGSKWAHVSCALWIPEVSIGSVEKMEPITKISSIPQSRWALICVLCRERVGACIQCSVKSCKTAYHVTCAFKHGLEMRAIIEDEAADDGVKLRSYCQKHSVPNKDKKSSASSEDDESKRKKRKDMTSEEKNQARAAKLQEIEAEFDKHVSHTDVKQCLDVDPEGILFIYNFWKLKRRAGGNKPLLAPKSDDVDLLSQKQEQADQEKMRMFVQLRQDLERVRNLCYMVSRREKLSRSFFRMREQTFHKQAAVLGNPKCALTQLEVQAVIEANHGPSIYDRLYSHPTPGSYTIDFDVILARIAGLAVPEDKEKPKVSELNGLVKSAGGRRSGMDNPYKRLYLNGASRRRSSLYGSTSGSETDTGAQPRKDSRLVLDSSASSTEEDKHPVERKPLRDKNESKTSSPSPAKSPNKASRAAMLGLDSAGSSTEDEKPSTRKVGRNRKSSPISAKLNEDTHLTSSKTGSRLASLGLESGGSSTEDEKPKLDKKSRNKKPPPASVKKSAEKEKASSKAATIARLGLDSPGSSTEDEKPSVRKLTTDATAPGKRKGRKSAVASTRSRKDSSTEDEEPVRPVNSKSLSPRNHIKKSVVDSAVSEDSDNDLLIRSSSKTDSKKLSAAIYSDSDSDASKDGSSSNLTGDHQQNMMRTKGAMKEFSGAPSKSGSKSPKKSVKAKSKEDGTLDDVSKDKENIKSSKKKDNVATDLIVPQRQAAKKASESIQKGSQGRSKESDLEKDPSVKQGSADLEKPKTKSKTKDEEKRLRHAKDSKSSSDIYEFDKDPESLEILAYVPQRQAAKKASDNMKTSIKKTEKDSPEPVSVRSEKGKEKTDTEKLKKPVKPEPKVKKVSKSSSSSSSSSTSSSSSSGSSSNSSSSSSDSDSDARSKSPAKKETRSEKSPESVSDVKKGTAKKEDWPFLGKVPQSSDSSSLDSDSDSNKDKDRDTKRPPSKLKPPSKEKEGSISHLAGKKLRKAPDKKLKTSDGRPELELQQPPFERDEPFRSKEKVGANKVSISSKSAESCDRLRAEESGPVERRSGNLPDAKSPFSTKEDSTPPKSQQGRSRARSKRTEESPVDRGRAGEQDSSPKKDQSKPGKRKPDESEETSPLRESRSSLGRSETTRRGSRTESPSKEKTKPEHSSPEVKKVTKKIDITSPDREITERRKSTRNASVDVTSPYKKQENVLNDGKKLEKSPFKEALSTGLKSPKIGAQENEIGLKHDDEQLVTVFNSILSPVDKDISVIAEKQKSETESLHEKKTSESSSRVSTSSSSSSSSSSSVEDDVTSKDKSQLPAVSDKIPVELPQEEITQKQAASETGRDSSLDLGPDFTATDQELSEPKKISSRNSSLGAGAGPYQQRSIFSPQQPKDSGVSDLFDFQNDLYAVDETVGDGDGFGLSTNSEEIMRAPLQFSFSNDLLFKEDSKEDTTRETLNLVDKLRLSYAQQKSQPNDTPDVCASVRETQAPTEEKTTEPDIVEVPVLPKPPIEEVNLTDDRKEIEGTDSPAMIPPPVGHVHEPQPINKQLEITGAPLHKSEAPSFQNVNADTSFGGYPCVDADTTKSLPGNKIIDSTTNAQADERWVPPSSGAFPHPPLDKLLSPPKQTALGSSPQQRHSLGQLPREQLPPGSASQHSHEQSLPFTPQVDISQPQPVLQQDLKKSVHHQDQLNMGIIPHDHFDSMAHTPHMDSSIANTPRIDSSMGHTPHMDSPTPYSDLHSQDKWADSHVLPVRCNSATSDSTDSDNEDRSEIEPVPAAVASVPSQANAEPMPPYQPAGLQFPNTLAPQATQVPQIPQVPPYQSYPEAPQFAGPVPMFQQPTYPGANMYPTPYPSFQDHSHNIIPAIPKPEELSQQIPPPSTAAFTCSSHNMAFTAAMVSPLPQAPPTPSPVLPQDPPLTPAAFPTSTAPPTPSPVLPHDTQVASTPFSGQTLDESQTDISAAETNHQLSSAVGQNAKVATSVGKKTPTKPTRSSPRVISLQHKSPGKSPGKSPRQQEPPPVKTATQARANAGTAKRNVKVPRNTQTQARARGRGKGKGRGGQHGFNDMDFGIHSKLAGTVYDLDFDDDDMTESVENLRAMRERRKSTDVHERKGSDSSYQSQESSLSPRFSSPSHISTKHRGTVYSQNLSDLRPPSPFTGGDEEDEELNPSPEPEEAPEVNQIQNIECLLPGPVDMRTYSVSYDVQPTGAEPPAFQNHLLGSLAAEQPESDLVDDLEKEMQQAAAKDKEKQIEEPRVSLHDSRQQLKVKIKGPFLDANYTATAPSVTPISQQQQPIGIHSLPTVPPLDAAPGPGMAPGSTMSAASSGTSNLRRMRKKELLRQYCSQDMNMDETGAAAMPGHLMQPMAAPPINRTVISIPKAVASMPNIPTREDYKAVVDANMEKKRKKDKAPNFANSYARRSNAEEYDDVGSPPERRRSVGSTESNNSFSTGDNSQPLKRRGRALRNPSATVIAPEGATAPKLKIKIGGASAEVAVSNPEVDKKILRVRPPKKRLNTPPAPSLEELRRESMKFRRQIMANFEDDNNETLSVPSVAPKKKKKKKKSSRSSSPLSTAAMVKVITNEVTAPKLIIRFGNKGSSSANCGSSSASVSSASGVMGDVTGESDTRDRIGEVLEGKTLESRTESGPTKLGHEPSVPPVATPIGTGNVGHVLVDKNLTSDASALRRVRSSKSATPIRLKLARCEEGYVAKNSEILQDGGPSPDKSHNSEMNTSTLPLSQDCEVR